MDDFVIARNPDPQSALPYLLRLPLPRPVVLKARRPGRVPRRSTAWAVTQDMAVSAKGRIPQPVLTAYDAAHP